MKYTAIGLLMGMTMFLGCGDTDNENNTNTPVRMILELENISDATTFKLSSGDALTVPLAPGFFAVTSTPDSIYAKDVAASTGVETLAEVGNPNVLIESTRKQSGTSTAGIWGDIDNPDYKESPILPGKKASVVITIEPGQKLVLASMLGVSNDTFLGTVAGGIALDDIDPKTSTDVTGQLVWWDAGTEVNEPIGEGPNQVSNAPGTDSGEDEKGVLHPAPLTGDQDAILLPDVSKVVRVTLKPL